VSSIEYLYIEPELVVGIVILAVGNDGEIVRAGLNDALRVLGVATVEIT